MQKTLLLCALFLLTAGLIAQPLYVDLFDDGVVNAGDTDKFTFTEANGEFTVSGNGTNGPWDPVYIGIPEGATVDITASPKLFVRAKASILGTVIRMDIGDGDNWSNVAPISKTLTNDYIELEFDFTGVDVGPLDLTIIKEFLLFVDPGGGGFMGDVVFDYIALGEAPVIGQMSDIYQDHFDSDSTFANWVTVPFGYTIDRGENEAGDSTEVVITGDGTGGPWTPFAVIFRSAPEFIQTNVDISDNPKLYVKVKSSVPGTSFRIDVQDTDNFGSAGNAVTKILDSEYSIFEYDFTDAFQPAIEGTPCNEANEPCQINLEAIRALVIFVNGGTGAFAGTITVDYISFGNSLEPPGEEAPLVYSDQFDNGTIEFIGGSDGYALSEADNEFKITGDGTSGEFATVSYTFRDATDEADTAFVARTVNFDEAQGKLFLRMKTDGEAQPVRIDLVDTSGLVTNGAAVNRRVQGEYDIYTYDFTANYTDFGYGGAEGCTPAAPCLLDATAISSMLFYVRPGDGLFNGELTVDWLSIGQPLDEVMVTEPGIANYSDTLNGVDAVLGGVPGGLTSTVEDGVWTISGDGSAGQYQLIQYTLRDAEDNAEKADVIASGDKLYIRARSVGGESAVLRVDLVDEGGFKTTNAGNQQMISGSEFATYVYDYNGGYRDGGYGGTACPGPAGVECPVDGQRITMLDFYPDPDDGGFNKTIAINWISFGEELSVNVRDFAELDGLSIYPNPATNQIGVEYDLPAVSEVSLTLYDGLGRRVIDQQLGRRSAGNNFDRLDLSLLAVGTYHLRVSVNGAPARAVTVLKR